ncbi:MAG: isocitrate dehydrogenase [Alphaproteobacteria bacterium CG11_big_fil_rev_8_21_14_0_20_44_7]|nr:MAG: isocitrate dehydrogenase [Alphaproteobacteria bacterium CG11_big_fil_rev_8_21_14_0_20_44_7]
MSTPITVAYGDGIGPEIMEATLKILMEGGAKLDIETIQIGEELYKMGFSSGFDKDAWNSINRTKVLLKAPITTPQGGGYKSLNVTLRKSLGLYANVRPCRSYHPFVETDHPKMDLVVVRENEEDLYAGIEYRLSANTYESLKLITKQGSEKICRYAFEYAVKNGRKKVSCFVKDNIMKMADGAFHNAFKEVAKEYPQIETDSHIIDIACARLATRPEMFDVIVTENLYGDIISDIAAEISGSVGLAGSSNIGDKAAMFEAIHGSAPDIAGKGIANPSGILLGAIQMLTHIGQPEAATAIHNALLKTIEDGVHTGDIYKEGISKKHVGTEEFTKAVVENMGEKPQKFSAVEYKPAAKKAATENKLTTLSTVKPEIRGIDVFIGWGEDTESLAAKISGIKTANLTLGILDFRGLKVWPKGEGTPDVEKGEIFRARFRSPKAIEAAETIELLGKLSEAGIAIAQTATTYMYGEEKGYSLAQGE